MGTLIDTSVLITYERLGQPVQDLKANLALADEHAIGAITASELLMGVHRAQPAARQVRRNAYVEAILRTVPVVSFDLTIARVHSRLWAALAQTGQIIGPHDFLIAATALAIGYELLTDNIREFSRVPGLEIRQPTW